MQGEQVVGIIPMARSKTGFFSSKAYTLVVTTHRLLVAEARKELVDAEIQRSRDAAQAGGSGFMGRLGAQIKASNAFGRQYLDMDPEAILAETPGNVAISPGEIRQLKVDRKTRNAGSDDDMDMPYLHVTLEATAGKRTFDTDVEHPSLDEARALVARLQRPA